MIEVPLVNLVPDEQEWCSRELDGYQKKMGNSGLKIKLIPGIKKIDLSCKAKLPLIFILTVRI